MAAIHFAPVPGYEDYYWATTCGDVWSLKTDRFLKQRTDRDGYKRVTLYKDGIKKTMYVHRVIADTFVSNDDPENRTICDHINRVRTDNRACNLRWASKSENLHNVSKKPNASSHYIGVSWNKTANKWHATIGINGSNKYLGLFIAEQDAARAYDRAALEHFGTRANINFP